MKISTIINTAAYTDVDKAEEEEIKAFNINALAPKAFSEKLILHGGKLLQISTDYVFDGKKEFKTPYLPAEKRSPLGIYGLSKAKAEEAIEEIFQDSFQGIILRTSWLIGPVGKNFLLTILNLHLKNKEIKVVNDQIGSPTSTFSLAKICWKIIYLKEYKLIFTQNKNRILHWQDNGETSWYKIALTISDFGKQIGLLKNNTKIIPIKSSQYPSLVKRPPYSVLDCKQTKSLLNYEGQHWELALKEILKKIQLYGNNSNSSNSKF